MPAIKMNIHAITLDPDSNTPILILKEAEGEKTLPIWIGLLEATAIATEMEKLEFARPMTHDLIINLLGAMDVEIARVEITELTENTYYANISLRKGDQVVLVDARPSDAVAVALRADADIYVNEAVLEKTKPSRGSLMITEESLTKEKKKWTSILEDLDPEAFKYKI